MGYSLSTDALLYKGMKSTSSSNVEDVHKIDSGENAKNVYGLTSATVIDFNNPRVSAGGVPKKESSSSRAEGKDSEKFILRPSPLRKRSRGFIQDFHTHQKIQDY